MNDRCTLELVGLDVFYGEVQALFDVSLRVAGGEVVALVGANGAGKTTTLRAVLGLTKPRRGRVVFGARDITDLPTHRIARSGVGWVPEDRRVFPSLTVARNLRIARRRSPFRAWTLKECFSVFSALEYLQSRECENLSGGEMQMVAIARMLVGGPGLVQKCGCSEAGPEHGDAHVATINQLLVQDCLRTPSELRRRVSAP